MQPRRISRRPLIIISLAALLLGGLLPGCGSDGNSKSITVAAASSLSGAFEAAKTEFEASHPGTSITLAFGSSSSLAQQILDGARIDVFASADNDTMQRVNRELAGRASTFTTNTLEIMVEKGNPLGIATLSDLARPELVYITCAPEVPIGKYSAEVLTRAGVTVAPSSLEPDVKGIVTKITSGEADAGIVYSTDVVAAGDRASGVVIPMRQNVMASYPIARLYRARHNTTAAAWIDFINGAEGQTILTRFGFIAP
jgi:molybdate transport system substrate-binding protein